jgi:hypothetical protein
MAARMEGKVLVVRDRAAVLERALSLVLFVAFAGIAAMLAFSPPAEAPGWALGLFGIIGPLAAALAVWWTCARAETVETRVDPHAEEVVIRRRTLMREVLGKLAFDDIAAVEVERRGSGEDEMHYVVLTLRNGRRVEVDKGNSPTGIAAVRNTLARSIGV